MTERATKEESKSQDGTKKKPLQAKRSKMREREKKEKELPLQEIEFEGGGSNRIKRDELKKFRRK